MKRSALVLLFALTQGCLARADDPAVSVDAKALAKLKFKAAAPASLCAPDVQEKRSAELQTIAAADQADRQGNVDKIDWDAVTPRDVSK